MRRKKCPSTKRIAGLRIAVQWYRVQKPYKKRPLGLILLLLMILMGFEVGTKKPLCISSKIVNKIDRVALSEDATSKSTFTESIYSCSTYKIPAFSVYFYENLDSLNSRLSKIEKVSALLGLHGRLDIEINETSSGQLKLKNNKIIVSRDSLDNGNLEKLVVSVLLLQNMKFESAQFVGFLSGWLTGQVNADSGIEEIWNDSFQNLDLYEKFKFKEAVFSELRKFPDFRHKSLSENMLDLLKSESSSVQSFKTVFEDKMKNLGIADTSSGVDLIFQNKSGSDFDSENLLALAKRFKTKRILFEDETGAYVLPTMAKLDASANSQLKTQLRVLLVDNKTALNFNPYFKNTERLVVFKSKAVASKLNFSNLFASEDLTKNELSFLNANKNFDVIQFHVPSLRYRQSQLSQIKDYFGLLKEAKSFAAKKKQLGWESEVWSIEAQAFKPIAVYDVIQYYRIN